MPEFSLASRRHLATCHQDLQVLCRELIAHYDITVVCGFRSREDQDAAYRAGASSLQWPDSKHNREPSWAVDLAPYEAQIRDIDWGDAKAFCVLAGRVDEVARRLRAEGRMQHRIRWGGDWDSDGRTVDQQLHDLPHYELIPG